MQTMNLLCIALIVAIALPLYHTEAIGSEEMHDMANMTNKLMSNDPCYAYNTSCFECAKQGCNYCMKTKGTPYCTSVQEKHDAGCDLPGCSSDTWIVKLALCSNDGCNSARDCDTCTKNPGCGFCQNGDLAACMEPDGKTMDAPTRCTADSAWTVNRKNCSDICERRWYRELCLEPTRACVWDATANKCAKSSTGKPEEINIPPPTEEPIELGAPVDAVETQSVSDSNEGYGTGLVVVLGVGLLIGAFIVKKLR